MLQFTTYAVGKAYYSCVCTGVAERQSAHFAKAVHVASTGDFTVQTQTDLQLQISNAHDAMGTCASKPTDDTAQAGREQPLPVGKALGQAAATAAPVVNHAVVHVVATKSAALQMQTMEDQLPSVTSKVSLSAPQISQHILLAILILRHSDNVPASAREKWMTTMSHRNLQSNACREFSAVAQDTVVSTAPQAESAPGSARASPDTSPFRSSRDRLSRVPALVSSPRRLIERPSSTNGSPRTPRVGTSPGPSGLRISTSSPKFMLSPSPSNRMLMSGEALAMTAVPEKEGEIQTYTPGHSRRPSISGTLVGLCTELSPLGRPKQRSLSVDMTRRILLSSTGDAERSTNGARTPNGASTSRAFSPRDAPDSPFRSGRYDQIGGVPQPLSWVNSSSNLLQSRYGATSFSVSGAPAEEDISFLARTEAVWTYYAKAPSATELSKKGLYRLSEDVLDEFIERYKAKLRKVHENESSYGQAEVDRDLRADLPIMLPAKLKEGQQVLGHDNYVKYIMRYAINKLATSAGQVSTPVSRRPSVSHSRRPTVSLSHAPSLFSSSPAAGDDVAPSALSMGLIKKSDFIRGWRSCQAELFALINNADGKLGGICAIM